LGEAIEGLALLEEVHHVFQTTGEYDVVAVAHVKDMDHLNGLKQRIKMVRGVKDVTTWVATRLVKIETIFNFF
ncbi:MAG: Lrp/AsnC ligand binding domain-containing protein, partial [Nitrososphaerales archaeon]